MAMWAWLGMLGLMVAAGPFAGPLQAHAATVPERALADQPAPIELWARTADPASVRATRGFPPAGGGIGLLAQAGELPPDYAASVEVRLSRMENRLRDLTGQLERLEHDVGLIEDRLDRALADIEFRLGRLEGAPEALAAGEAISGTVSGPPPGDPGETGAGTPGPGEPAGDQVTGSLGNLPVPPGNTAQGPAAPPPEAPSLPHGTASDRYDRAYGLLQQADFAAAEQALRSFVAEHPDHQLASNAQYWLGETYYVRGRFNEAAVAFARGYQNFPEGSKAVDSLLKLAMSLGAMGQTEDACLTFDELGERFPNAPAAIQRRAQQERDRWQCP